MTTAAKLLARKQQLLDRLQESPGPHERDQIERLLAEIDTALDSVEEAGGSSARRGSSDQGTPRTGKRRLNQRGVSKCQS